MTASKTATAAPVQWVAVWPLVLAVDARRRTTHVYQDQTLPEGVDPSEVQRLVALGAVRPA